MAKFTVRDRDGKIWKLDAIDIEAAVAAFKKFQPEPDPVAVDVAKSLPIGVARTAISLAGLPGTIGKGMVAGTDFLARAAGIEPPSAEARAAVQPPINLTPTGSELQADVESVTGKFRQPQTTAGKFAQTIGEFAPGAFIPGSMAQRFLAVVAPAIGSEAAGQLTEGTPIEGAARFGGAVIGAVTPAGVARAITPLTGTAARQQAAQVLQAEGVTSLTAGQITGSKGLKAFEAQKGGATAKTLIDDQAEQFTAAILKKVGSTERKATPGVVDKLFDDLGKEFDTIAANNTLIITDVMRNNLRQISEAYKRSTAPSARIPLIQDLADFAASARAGTGVRGKVYQDTRSSLDKAARNTIVSDPNASIAMREMRSVIDDTMEASIAKARPADLGAWRDMRRRYRNMLVVERGVSGAGEAAAQGLISPQQLRAGILKVEKVRGRARGRSEFDELQRSGELILKPLPDSGTALNIRVGNLGLEPGVAAAGGAVGFAVGGPTGAAIGGLAGAALPGAVARAFLSKTGRRLLSNRALAESAVRAQPGRAVAIGAGLESTRQ